MLKRFVLLCCFISDIHELVKISGVSHGTSGTQQCAKWILIHWNFWSGHVVARQNFEGNLRAVEKNTNMVDKVTGMQDQKQAVTMRNRGRLFSFYWAITFCGSSIFGKVEDGSALSPVYVYIRFTLEPLYTSPRGLPKLLEICFLRFVGYVTIFSKEDGGVRGCKRFVRIENKMQAGRGAWIASIENQILPAGQRVGFSRSDVSSPLN